MLCSSESTFVVRNMSRSLIYLRFIVVPERIKLLILTRAKFWLILTLIYRCNASIFYIFKSLFRRCSMIQTA